jgi:signal peptidase II
MRAASQLTPTRRALALGAIFAADRLTKLWALSWLAPRRTLRVLPFLHLTYVENTGAAFGIGTRRNSFFIALTAALIAGLLYLQGAWARKNGWVRLGLILVAGGALGNLYDRVCYGYVVDFLDFLVWPVFNVADSCVCVGAACLFWGLREEEKASG